jgi:hypothetical protein
LALFVHLYAQKVTRLRSLIAGFCYALLSTLDCTSLNVIFRGLMNEYIHNPMTKNTQKNPAKNPLIIGANNNEYKRPSNPVFDSSFQVIVSAPNSAASPHRITKLPIPKNKPMNNRLNKDFLEIFRAITSNFKLLHRLV